MSLDFINGSLYFELILPTKKQNVQCWAIFPTDRFGSECQQIETTVECYLKNRNQILRNSPEMEQKLH